MASIPAGPWVRILSFFAGDKVWTQTLWYKLTSAPPSGFDISSYATTVAGQSGAAFTAVMNAAYTWGGSKVYVNNGSYTASYEVYSPGPGQLTNAAVPEEICAIVPINADQYTREGQGRIFVAGLDSSLVDQNRISTAGVAALSSFVTAIKAAATASDLTPTLAVWSRKGGALLSPVYPSFTSILSALRRRRPRY